MGMFDYLKINYRLPLIDIEPPYLLQTKDFDCNLDTFEINQFGRLIREKFKYEYEYDDDDDDDLVDINFDGKFSAIVCEPSGIDDCFMFYFKYGVLLKTKNITKNNNSFPY